MGRRPKVTVKKGHASMRLLDRTASLVAGAALGATAIGVFDLVTSVRGAQFAGVVAAGSLFFATGALFGLVLAVIGLPRLAARGGLVAAILSALVRAGVGVLVVHYGFRTPLGGTTTWRFRFATLGVAVVGFALPRLLPRDRAGRLLVVFGLVTLAVDRLVLVSVYERAHTVIEGAAVIAFTVAVARWIEVNARVRLARVLGVSAVAWLALVSGSRTVRRAIERPLPPTWEQPVYLGRLLQRMRIVEAIAEGRAHGDIPAGIARLAERYEVHDTDLDDEWRVQLPASESAPPLHDVPASSWNIVFFFVDALRADVASDERIMPEVSAWTREHLSFANAYSPASSTVLTLAPTLSCRYEARPDETPSILRTARDRGMTTALFIPRAASEYHRGAFPAFRFDHEEVVRDQERERVPTAEELVGRSFEWLDQARPSRFLLWVYQYDVHSWGDLPWSYVDAVGSAAGLPSEGLPLRYRAAAHATDRAFARLRAGLRERGLLDRTVIVFLADHGEALGEQGFWAHSTFLWESLVRVPLAIEVPDLPPRRIEAAVSLVDLPTTLSRFVGSLPDEERCHGEDLLREDLDQRRLPILLSAMVDGELARVGILESRGREGRRKLVVDLREGEARLLDLPDENDVSALASGEAAHLLNRLVRSPIYPRL